MTGRRPVRSSYRPTTDAPPAANRLFQQSLAGWYAGWKVKAHDSSPGGPVSAPSVVAAKRS